MKKDPPEVLNAEKLGRLEEIIRKSERDRIVAFIREHAHDFQTRQYMWDTLNDMALWIEKGGHWEK